MWLVERDWHIVNHWEDHFCRKVYQDLCCFAEFQHLRATALVSPGTTPLVCPVDDLVNTHPSPPLVNQVNLATLASEDYRGAAKAYRESQTSQAPLFVGVGEGTDNLDFLADLSALKVITPEEVARATPVRNQPVPKSDSLLLYQLKNEQLPYAEDEKDARGALL